VTAAARLGVEQLLAREMLGPWLCVVIRASARAPGRDRERQRGEAGAA
jgi:hypothetical protein